MPENGSHEESAQTVAQASACDATVQADELIEELAEMSAEYGEDYEEKRGWWVDSLDHRREFLDAKYWMMEALGARRATAWAIAELQPGGRFRDTDGTVDLQGYMTWLERASEEAHQRSKGPYQKTRQADEAESAYAAVLSLLRNDYGFCLSLAGEITRTMEADMP